MKKLISNVAGFILIISVIILGFAFTARKYLNVDSVQSMLKQVFHATESYNESFFTTLVNGSDTKDVYKKYFNEEEIEELYTRYLAEYILYSNGVIEGERPEFDDLKNKVDGYLAEYETETGQEADRKGSFNFFYNLDENTANMTFFSPKVKKVIQFLLNDTVRDVLIGVILVCVVLIIIFNRNIDKIILHISSIFISDGVGLLVLKFALDKHFSKIIPNPFINSTMDKLSDKMYTIAIYSIIIGAVFLGIFILYRILFRRKEKPNLTKITDEAIPTINQFEENPVPRNFQNPMPQTGTIPMPIQQPVPQPRPVPQPVQQQQVKNDITSEFEFDFDSRPKNKKTRVQQVLESKTLKNSGALVTDSAMPQKQRPVPQPMPQSMQPQRPLQEMPQQQVQQPIQQPRPVQQPKVELPKPKPKPAVPKQMPQPMQPKQDEPFVEQIFPDQQ